MTGPDEFVVLTVGHSTRPIDEFIDLLKANDVTLVVDIRTIPRSRHNPQFNKDVLPISLAEAGIEYTHCAGLGGLRHTLSDSPNTGWRNASFRGFADYMQSEEFQDQVEDLVALARHARAVLMCAEAVPWRCHRSLVSDALLVRGVRVFDIMGKDNLREHALTGFARIHGKKITYPPTVAPP